MQKNFKRSLSLLTIIFLCTASSAQINEHLIGSKFGGTLGVGLNPAANNQNKFFDVNLYSAAWNQDFFDKAYYPSSTEKNIYKADYKLSFPGVLFNTNHVKNGRKRQFAFGLTSNQYGISRIESSQKNLWEYLYRKSSSEAFTNAQASEYSHSYSDLGLTFAYNIVQKERGQLNFGLTAKQLTGWSLRVADYRDITFNTNDGLSSVAAYQFYTGDYSRVESNEDILVSPPIFNNEAKNKPTALAGDVGFVFNYLKKASKIEYQMNDSIRVRRDVNPNLFSIGVSARNIGQALKYEKGDLPTERVEKSLIGIDPTATYADALEIKAPMDVIGYFEISPASSLGINLNFRYTEYQTFNGNSFINKTEQTAGAILKIEKKGFGFYIPAMYSLDANNDDIEIGLALRLGFFNVRLDNLMPYLDGQDIKTGVFFGFTVPLHRKVAKDDDDDMVSNEYDKCPGEIGSWHTLGCPDTDGDSIPDHKDDCISEAGPIKFNGCPDTDGDGIIDKLDECDTIFGLKEFEGCPDTDGDGVEDKNDWCKLKPGKKEWNGCPDTDGDGLHDAIDKCPNSKGAKEAGGCYIDSDNDGVENYLDSCPTVAGDPALNGCPVLSLDKYQSEVDYYTKNFKWDINQASLNDQSADIVEELADFLEDYPDLKLDITVLAEDTSALAQELAVNRIKFLSNLFLNIYGLNYKRVTVHGVPDKYYINKFTIFKIEDFEN